MTEPLKVVFAGTPEFAAVALRALLGAGFHVPLIFTQPDRQAGRGMALQASAVKQVALAHRIPVLQPQSLKGNTKEADAFIAELQATPHDVMVVAAYGLILPQLVLNIPPAGCINIHASLLPRWRGAAPIHRAIQAGDGATGVCIMRMEAGLDTGPVYSRQSFAIAPNDTTATLHDKLAGLGGQMIVAALPEIVARTRHPEVQNADGVTYAAKIEKSEAPLDFTQSAQTLARQIRAFNPFPGATLRWNGQTLKAFSADVLEETASKSNTGAVLQADASEIVVQCASSALRITELQKPGGKRLPVKSFLQSLPIAVGDLFQ